MRAACLHSYGCVLPWNNIAQNLIIKKFICDGECCALDDKNCPTQLDAEHKSSFVMGIPYTMSAILSPFLGGAIDRVGGRAFLSMVSACCLIGVHSAISFIRHGTLADLYAPLVFQGLSYAVFAAALWPSVPYVVKRVRACIVTARCVVVAPRLTAAPVVAAAPNWYRVRYYDSHPERRPCPVPGDHRLHLHPH